MVEAKIYFNNLCDSNPYCFNLVLWNKIPYAVVTTALDNEIYWLLFIVCNISIINMVSSGRIAIHAKNNNMFAVGIYNSYGSNFHEIITRYSNK